MNRAQMNSHWEASSMVKHWRAPVVASLYEVQLGACLCSLAYPGEGYRVAVVFWEVVGKPEAIRIRATNWRCEDEPNGVYTREAARALFVRLRKAGFEPEATGE